MKRRRGKGQKKLGAAFDRPMKMVLRQLINWLSKEGLKSSLALHFGLKNLCFNLGSF